MYSEWYSVKKRREGKKIGIQSIDYDLLGCRIFITYAPILKIFEFKTSSTQQKFHGGNQWHPVRKINSNPWIIISRIISREKSKKSSDET